MNLSELARKLKITTKELKQTLPELGFDIGMRAIQIDDKTVEKVLEKWPEYLKSLQKQIAEKIEEKTEIKIEEKSDEKMINLPPFVTVHQLSQKLNFPVTRVIKELMKNGIIATINEQLDYETASIICQDMGFKTKAMAEEEEKETEIKKRAEKLKNILEEEKNNDQYRPPVVVVMGHVDHGKTMLLDKIRETNVMATEKGGITQRIGAYQVEKNNRLITFIDTPGHEAFKSLRTRGGAAADIAILVVAADDKVQPQTIEAIRIIQEEKLPFLVALNKIDKSEADIERLKKELSEINLVPEEWGGNTICVPISAKSGEGIDNLLETIILLADLDKENFLTNPNREAVGIIIESKIDREAGTVASVLVMTGTLKLGDNIIVGNTYGKIKAMKDCNGKFITQAAPSMPVGFLGFKDAPDVGDILEVINDAKQFKEKIKELKKHPLQKNETFGSAGETNKDTKTLNIILKADMLGSLEAISQSLEKITAVQAKIQMVKKGLGDITEEDVSRAETTHASIIGFSIKTTPSALLLANSKNIEIKNFEIIYELIEYLKEKLLSILEPDIIRTELGEMEVIAIFRTEKDYAIIGARVKKGKAVKNAKAEVMRNEQIISRGTIAKLEINKIEVDELEQNKEGGIKYQGKSNLAIGDKILLYSEQSKAKTLQ